MTFISVGEARLDLYTDGAHSRQTVLEVRA